MGTWAVLVALVLLAGCQRGRPPSREGGVEDAVTTSLRVAQEYVDAYFHRYAEEAFEAGYGGAPLDRFSDRSLSATARWHQREDAWLRELTAIDASLLQGTEAAIPYAYARERLEASRDIRACQLELWNVSPTWTGWSYVVASTLANQPVSTPDQRRHAVARARDVARFVDTETDNLREGLRRGYTAPRSNVEAVIAQLESILDSDLESSPFWAPATKEGAADLGAALRPVIEREILPAVQRHRDFLAGDYLNRAREEIGVTANPQGAECYEASIRFYTALPLSPRQIHANGLAAMEKIQSEMLEIARRSFDTTDIPALMERLRSEARFTFGSEQEILEFVDAAIARAEAVVGDWFGFVPDAEVIVRPYPAYQKTTGGGFYSAGSPGQPGVYELGTYDPRQLPRAGLEATTFHETYPGHHLQGSVALARAGLHPVLKYFYNSGMGEGWALYTERLADEMQLYGGDVDRIGLLSNEALRAARLVVDPGMHVLGWSRQQAIDYLLAHTAESRESAASEIDRYVAVPAQATSYMTGSLEIRRLRDEAQRELGEHFDVRVFHDLVLADGTVTLGMLRDKVRAWIDQQKAARP